MKIQKNAFPLLLTSFLMWGLVYFKTENTELGPGFINSDTVKNSKNVIYIANLATEKSLASLIKEKKALIIHYGFAPVINPEFEKKYGIKIKNEGCVINSAEDNPVAINNKLVSKYLTKNFGEDWKKELGFLPLGTK